MGRNYKNVVGKNNPNYKFGFSGKKWKQLYNSWQNMKSRCLRENHPKYHRYGGRGITISKDWMTIKGFADWALSSGWKNGLTIDRIDNDGNYEPKNCRWVSASENSRKKRTTKISFDDAKKIRERAKMGECEYSLAKEYGVVHGTVWFILNNFTHVSDGECTKAINRAKQIKPIDKNKTEF